MNKIGRYEILDELGKGAMGIVYRANDPLLNRIVAVKTVNMELDPEEMAEYEARFYQEARAAGGLNHPNIVTIHDIGKSRNLVYITMELLDGVELRALISRDERITAARAVEICAQVADGLAYAHQSGVVHRDVKPANIMILRSGTAKIMDFGIARMRQSEVRTQTGIVLGSPRYMSPEQVSGKRADPRSDTFSLGVILYEMVTGKPPFTGEDVTSVMYQILNTVPPPPSSLNPAVPTMLDFVAAKALAKSPDERYQDAAEFARDLHYCAKQIELVGAAPAPTPPPAPAGPDKDAAQALARSLPEAGPADAGGVTSQPVPALGLSKAFDSLEATAKLANRIGMAEALPDLFATTAGPAAEARAAIGAMRREPGWSREDQLIFAASVAGAIAVGAIIVFA